jgi:hypothetical protein
MTEEDTFDIYGDDESASPASPGVQAGPKKRLRRERSSSAPPPSKSKEEEEDGDGDATPRGKKIKEEKPPEEDLVGSDEDPFREYDNHVFYLRYS